MKKFIFVLSVLCIACHPSAHDNLDPSNPKEVVDDQRELSSPQTILMLGDSLASETRFAYKMVEYLTQAKDFCGQAVSYDNLVHFYARPSASPRHFVDSSGTNKDWLCRQKTIYRNGTAANTTGPILCQNTQGVSVFTKLLNKHEPTIVIVELISNSIGFSEAFIKSKVKQTLDQIPDGKLCYWIGPTAVSNKYLAKVRKAERALEEALLEYERLSCPLIKSVDAMLAQTQCEKFNVSDGLHHTNCGSELWAEYVFNNLCQLLDGNGPL
ncbi:MAG: SGNH/GDSL hydrolase family protein [Bdellovibrionales bacterium]|nr:SGNH/GDSL hydrolase family protein [Bdellovibrionales bacterium]